MERWDEIIAVEFISTLSASPGEGVSGMYSVFMTKDE